MKSYRLAIILIAAAYLRCVEAQSARVATADHLIIPERSDEKRNAYHRLLTSKLGVTPFDCGRVVDTPSFAPESMTSIYSETRAGRRSYYVVLVRPTANLWQQTRGMREPDNASRINITETRAELSGRIAEEIKQVWTGMLRTVRARPALGSEFVFEGYLYFSIQSPRSHPMCGELMLPAQGERTKALFNLTEDLWKYCEAAPHAHPTIADRIHEQCNWLLTVTQKREKAVR